MRSPRSRWASPPADGSCAALRVSTVLRGRDLVAADRGAPLIVTRAPAVPAVPAGGEDAPQMVGIASIRGEIASSPRRRGGAGAASVGAAEGPVAPAVEHERLGLLAARGEPLDRADDDVVVAGLVDRVDRALDPGDR